MNKIDCDESSVATLPWEAKTVVVVFSLLAMQQLHDGYQFCLGKSGLGYGKLQSASVILFILYVTLGIGLAKEQRWAWRFSVILVGGMAALQLWDTLELIRRTILGEPPPTTRMLSGSSIVCGMNDRLDHFRAAWRISQTVLMCAVPILLLLGQLRQTLIGESRRTLKPPSP